MKFRTRAALFCAVAMAASWSGAVRAQTTVGTIYACYYSAECTYSTNGTVTAPVDGPAFQINNTGTQAITAASLTIMKSIKPAVATDHYNIGTIKPGASAVIIVGVSMTSASTPPTASSASWVRPAPVSYTHLTLPTIYSV